MLELEKAIEMLKAELFLEMVGQYGEDTETMDRFIRTLVRNGCPFAAVMKTINEFARETEDGEDK